MTPNQPGQSVGWKVMIDGEETSVGMIEIVSRFGKLTYGRRPEGYDAWTFAEPGGGGAILMPFIRYGGSLFIGLISEKRLNMGSEPVLDCIGGFVDPGESHRGTMVREAGEESGIDARQAFELSGAPMNANRAFFVADPAMGEGVHVYAMQLDPRSSDIVMNEYNAFEFQGTLPGLKKEATVKFFGWREAIQLTPCALTAAAISRLLAHVL